jgi:glutathione S-transferase
MAELFGLSYSPWTEKARWALEHHRVSYRYVEHVPMLGEPYLRWKAQKLTGRVTVPLFVDGGAPVMDSLAIAAYAEGTGRSKPLFPAENRAKIEAWNARSERALAAARGLVVSRTAASPQAKAAALPPFVPDALRPALTSVASLGVAFFRLKYGLDAAGEDERRAVIAADLRTLRESLAGRPYLFDDFTYADIAMATVLQAVRPVDGAFLPLHTGTREAWTDPVLAPQFEDLCAWRDALYAKHRT